MWPVPSFTSWDADLRLGPWHSQRDLFGFAHSGVDPGVRQSYLSSNMFRVNWCENGLIRLCLWRKQPWPRLHSTQRVHVSTYTVFQGWPWPFWHYTQDFFACTPSLGCEQSPLKGIAPKFFCMNLVIWVRTISPEDLSDISRFLEEQSFPKFHLRIFYGFRPARHCIMTRG